MIDILSEEQMLALVGLLGGLALGLAARLGRFCTLGAIEDALYAGDGTRVRMWGVAIGIAMLGSFGLIGAGALDVSRTIYLGIGFQPAASAIGGLLFGYGMALAGNCGYGALARLGGGDLRALMIVLVMGLAAYATIAGPLAYLRVAVFPPAPADGVTPGLAHALAGLLGTSPVWIGLAAGLVILMVSLWSRGVWARRVSICWGIVVGAAIISGWAGTQWVADVGFSAAPVVSHTFAAPLGETMLYGMTASARTLSFGIGSVAGVVIGAFLGCVIKRQFRWEACEDPRELRRQLAGATLMGIGAVLAMGCSIGQGLSAISLLAYSAPIVMAGIFAGAWLGLRQLITGFREVV